VSGFTGSCTLPITGISYFKALGGGVTSGESFKSGAACSATPVAPLGGYTQHDVNSANSYAAGTGSQLLASASGFINGLVSGALLAGASTPAPGSPDNLTVANASSGTYGYGGDSGLTSDCLPDYYGSPSSNPAPPAPGDVDTGAVQAGSNKYYLSGNQTTAGFSVPDGARDTIYINGNLYISGNVTYANSGGWTQPSDIPALTLVVGGNIYVDPAVTELDGIYIAQPNGGVGGIIDDCAQSTFHPVLASNLYGSCNNQLVVVGSFIAKHIDLLRTYGSLKDALTTDSFSTSSSSCTNQPALVTTRTCAGEIFELSPEVYLSPRSNNGAGDWQAITSLPPVL
jgi:hypothetical protein